MSQQLSRREVFGGLGAASLLSGQNGNSFLQVPSWKTEMRQLAPNVSEYIQAGGPAHTWGDIMVDLPRQRILFAGDVAFHYVAPFAHNGHVSKWIEAVA